MGRWHDNRTPIDDARRRGYIVDLKSNRPDNPWISIQFIHDDFVECQRPTYLVSKEIAECASNLEITPEQVKVAFEHLPYQAFMFCFEKESLWFNLKYGQRELHSLIIYNIDTETDAPPILSIYEGGHNLGGYYSGGVESKLAAALLLLWRSRPHFIQPATLPRSERYAFKGNRELLRKWEFPTELLIRMRESGSRDAQGKWTVRPHWRAGHFRHYRHDKFKRNEDGSVKVEFIEPCLVGEEASAK